MVFYFTATGNSLYTAKKLDSRYISIPQVMKNENLHFSDDKIGIVCPVYGHEMPKMVKEFIRKSTFDTDYFYVILTYGALHGGAAEIADRYIRSAGKKADYINTIVMVDNFLPNFDMHQQMTEQKNFDKNIEVLKSDISRKKKYIQKAGIKDKMIHKGYLMIVKNQPETVWSAFRVKGNCIGCGICTQVCPGKCISINDGKAVYNLENCQACYACVHSCPHKAIGFTIDEKNPDARYIHPQIQLSEIIASNNQYDK